MFSSSRTAFITVINGLTSPPARSKSLWLLSLYNAEGTDPIRDCLYRKQVKGLIFGRFGHQDIFAFCPVFSVLKYPPRHCVWNTAEECFPAVGNLGQYICSVNPSEISEINATLSQYFSRTLFAYAF